MAIRAAHLPLPCPSTNFRTTILPDPVGLLRTANHQTATGLDVDQPGFAEWFVDAVLVGPVEPDSIRAGR